MVPHDVAEVQGHAIRSLPERSFSAPERYGKVLSKVFGFSRAHRIPGGKDFLRTLRTGECLVGTYAKVLARPNGLGHSRLAVVVGRKVGKATVRNRLKRLVREVFRTSPDIRMRGLDLLVIVKDARLADQPEEVLSLLRTIQKKG